MSVSADAVVIGAGVVGSSIAWQLAQSGLRVLIVDKAGGIGEGSTSASSAVVRFNFSTWAGVASAWEAKHHWENWREHLYAEPGEDLATFHPTGCALLDTDAFPRNAFSGHFDRAGVPYEEWDTAMLRERVPGIDAGRFGPPKRPDDDAFWSDATGELGAVFTPDAGFVDDPRLAAMNLASAARRAGAVFGLRRRITGIHTSANRVCGVLLDGIDRIDTRIVVNAAGPWSRQVNRLAGVGDAFTVGVRALRQEVHHVAAPPGYNTEQTLGIVLGDADLGIYLRPERGDGLLIGGTEPECDPLQWVDDPDDVDPNPTTPVFEAQVTRAARRFGNLAVPNRPRGVAGVYDVADDWLPIYDRTELDGFYVAIGTSGNQFKNAPLIGRFLRAIIEHVESGADHDMSPAHYTGEHTGLTVDLSAYSRLRPFDPAAPATVLA